MNQCSIRLASKANVSNDLLLNLKRPLDRITGLVQELNGIVEGKLKTDHFFRKKDTPKVARFSWILNKNKCIQFQQQIRGLKNDIALSLQAITSIYSIDHEV